MYIYIYESKVPFDFDHPTPNQESLALQLSIPFIFNYLIVLEGDFADVDDTCEMNRVLVV